jgi:NitT/TauT family transport system ATP-binding protein
MPSYPSSGVSQVFGLLDVLRAYKGKTNVAKLNMDLHLDIDDLLPPIATAELLELVTVKDGEISLTEIGRKILSSKMPARKVIIGEQLRKVDLYEKILAQLGKKKRLALVDVEELIEGAYGPFKDVHDGVRLVIRWGVFADLFDYDGAGIILHKPSDSPS